MDIKVGNKFEIKGISFDIEICGFFPASQNKDGFDMFNATLNGESMKIKKSFIENLLSLNEKAKLVEEPKKGKAEKPIEKVVEEPKVEKTDKKVGKKNKEK